MNLEGHQHSIHSTPQDWEATLASLRLGSANTLPRPTCYLLLPVLFSSWNPVPSSVDEKPFFFYLCSSGTGSVPGAAWLLREFVKSV